MTVFHLPLLPRKEAAALRCRALPGSLSLLLHKWLIKQLPPKSPRSLTRGQVHFLQAAHSLLPSPMSSLTMKRFLLASKVEFFSFFLFFCLLFSMTCMDPPLFLLSWRYWNSSAVSHSGPWIWLEKIKKCNLPPDGNGRGPRPPWTEEQMDRKRCQDQARIWRKMILRGREMKVNPS